MNNLLPEQLQSFDAVMVRPRTPPPAGSSASDTAVAGGSSDSTIAAPGLNVEGAPEGLKCSGIGRGDGEPSEQQQQRQTAHVLSTCAAGAKASGGGDVDRHEEAGAGSGVTLVAAGTPATNAGGGASKEGGGGGGGMTITVSQAGGKWFGLPVSLVLRPRSLEEVPRLAGKSSPAQVDATAVSRTSGCVVWRDQGVRQGIPGVLSLLLRWFCFTAGGRFVWLFSPLNIAVTPKAFILSRVDSLT